MPLAHVFGPVASGRLGRSLGLDLLGGRVCSMDCLYCEVGTTDVHTCERAPYVPAPVLLDELARWRDAETAKHGPAPGGTNPAALVDHVTLGGSGEPCLNSDLARIIAGCRDILPGVPVAVLTNSTLLHRDDVRADLAGADVVLPSLDSLVESEFRALNRPCKGVTARGVADGLLGFARGFGGRIWLEVLLARGINDTADNLALLRDYVRQLAPHRVDVTTLSRPGASPRALPVGRDVLSLWSDELNMAAGCPQTAPAGHGPTVTVPDDGSCRAANTTDAEAPVPPVLHSMGAEALQEAVLRSITRRPQTAPQLAKALGAPLDAVRKALDGLTARGACAPVAETALPRDTDGEIFHAGRLPRNG
ncbi:radical SAM protein [Nitratidesulfovibrio termitidis]|uniref:radical SAM protein n=1 Tax=Nitratidesulfovibrio termitidis TaxID=42252 RepID=UPI000559391A|nr:radical SAM protein [Nitratidesulfovibrio termitidis]